MRVLYSTAFTVADESPLSESGKWDPGTGWSGIGIANVRVTSNRVRVAAIGATDNSARLNTPTFPDNQYGQLDIVTLTGAGIQEFGILLRMAAAPTATWYVLNGYTNQATTTEIYSYVAGAFASLATVATTWAAGDKISASVTGTTLHLLKNGVVVLAVSDAAIKSGQPGIKATQRTGSAADLEVDNFEGDSLDDYVFDYSRFPKFFMQPQKFLTEGRLL